MASCVSKASFHASCPQRLKHAHAAELCEIEAAYCEEYQEFVAAWDERLAAMERRFQEGTAELKGRHAAEKKALLKAQAAAPLRIKQSREVCSVE